MGWSLALGFALSGCYNGDGDPLGPVGGGPSPGGGGTSDGVDRADIVARLTIDAPAQDNFIMRATLPVPKGTFSQGDALVPFSVVHRSGEVAKTQVEVVSRYANPADGADVVELIASVHRPEDASEGEPINFYVAHDPHPPGYYRGDPEIREFLGSPGSLQLRSHDVFGNLYTADLFRDVREHSSESKRLRNGELIQEFRTHEIMLPSQELGGPTGTLPHMMGVHSYIMMHAQEEFFTLDMHVHNGMSGNDITTPLDDPLQKIYFQDLTLRLPEGWTLLQAFDNPYLGEAQSQDAWNFVPIVRPMDNGAAHMMPRQGQFIRRFVVCKDGTEERARTVLDAKNLAFCEAGSSFNGDEYYSWWNEDTARYYPQSHRLPSLDHVDSAVIRAELDGDFQQYATQVRTGSTGQFPVTTGGLGWAHPYGTQYGGMTGGTEIHLYDGVEIAASASNSGYRLMQLTWRMYMDRQPIALYDLDGQPSTVESWLRQGSNGLYQPMGFFFTPLLPSQDPFGFNSAPTFQMEAAGNMGVMPAYDNSLSGYGHIDFQHAIRYTRHMKTLAWLGNDSMAKDELRTVAELFRLTFSQYPNSSGGYAQGVGLLSKMQYVDQFPGWGVAIGRGEAWGIDAAAGAYALGDDEFRETYYPWFELTTQVIADGQSTCTGAIQATPLNNYLGGNYRLRQSYETAITDNAICGIKECVFEGLDEARTEQINQILVDSGYASISDVFWNEAQHAPWSYMAVGPHDMSQPPFCGDVPSDGYSSGTDTVQYWSSFAYAYELSGDEEFLFRAAEMAGGGDLFNDLMNDGLSNLHNQAALLALMQSLNGLD